MAVFEAYAHYRATVALCLCQRLFKEMSQSCSCQTLVSDNSQYMTGCPDSEFSYKPRNIQRQYPASSRHCLSGWQRQQTNVDRSVTLRWVMRSATVTTLNVLALDRCRAMARSWKPRASCAAAASIAGSVHLGYELRGQVAVECFHSSLAADATVLDSADRCLCKSLSEVVDVDHACFQSVLHRQCILG